MPACLIEFGVNDVLQFDIEKSIAPELPVEVSEFPVEDGSVFADSVIRRPRVWNVTALVSNTPLVDTLNPRLSNGQTRVSAVWSRLVQAYQLRQPCAYSDDLDYAPVCIITNVTPARTAETQNALEMTLTIREMLIATAQRAKVRVLPSRGKRKNNGTKSGQTVTGQEANAAILAGTQAYGEAVIGIPTSPVAPSQSLEASQFTSAGTLNQAPQLVEPSPPTGAFALGVQLW